MAKEKKEQEDALKGALVVEKPKALEAEIFPEQEQLPLSEEERADLENLEQKIKSAVLDAAKALWEINERRLYRERYATFEEYCEQQFQFSSRYIYYQVKFGYLLNVLEKSERPVQILPQSEYQARPLAKLKDSKDQVEAWLGAVEKTQGKVPSFSVVDQVVREKITAKQSSKIKQEGTVLPEGTFCKVRGELARIIDSTGDRYELLMWNNISTVASLDLVKALTIDRSVFSRVESHFKQLGDVAKLVDRYRESTATAVLNILSRAELPPTDLEIKLLKCLEREMTRRDGQANQSEKGVELDKEDKDEK